MLKGLVLGMARGGNRNYSEMHELLEKTIEQVDLACDTPSVTTMKNWVAKHFTARYRLKDVKHLADRLPAGRPPVKFTAAMKAKARKSLRDNRGKKFWHAVAVKKDIKAPVHPKTISEYFRSIGYKKHPRAEKGYKSVLDKKERILFAECILKQTNAALSRYIVTDGMGYYAPMSIRGAHNRAKEGLGPWVLRKPNERLIDDCVGGTVYSKAQVLPNPIFSLVFSHF